MHRTSDLHSDLKKAWLALFRHFKDPYQRGKNLDVQSLVKIIENWKNFREELHKESPNDFHEKIFNFFSIQSIDALPKTQKELVKKLKEAIDNQVSKEIFLKTGSLYFAKDCRAVYMRNLKQAVKLVEQVTETVEEGQSIAAYSTYEQKKTEAAQAYASQQIKEDRFFIAVENQIIKELKKERNTLSDQAKLANPKREAILNRRIAAIDETIKTIDNSIRASAIHYERQHAQLTPRLYEPYLTEELAGKGDAIKRHCQQKIKEAIEDNLVNNKDLKDDWGTKLGRVLLNTLKKVPGVNHFFGGSQLFKPKKETEEVVKEVYKTALKLPSAGKS